MDKEEAEAAAAAAEAVREKQEAAFALQAMVEANKVLAQVNTYSEHSDATPRNSKHMRSAYCF